MESNYNKLNSIIEDLKQLFSQNLTFDDEIKKILDFLCSVTSSQFIALWSLNDENNFGLLNLNSGASYSKKNINKHFEISTANRDYKSQLISHEDILLQSELLNSKNIKYITSIPLYLENKIFFVMELYSNLIIDERVNEIFPFINNLLAYNIERKLNLRKINELNEKINHQEELRKRELDIALEQFKKIFEYSKDAIVYINYEGKLIDFNNAFQELSGYERAELFKLNYSNTSNKKDREKEIDMFMKLIETGIGQEYERDFIRKDKKVIRIQISIFLVKDQNDKTIGFGAIVRDITERIKNDREFRKLQHRLELILDSAGEGIFGLDKYGRVTFINPAAEKFFKWPHDELIGEIMHVKTHYKKTDGSDYERSDCPIWQSYNNGKISYVPYDVFWKKDGTSFPVEYISTPIKANNKLLGAVVSFSDITDRIESEKLLRSSEERFKNAFDFAPIGIVMSDLKGNFIHVNKAFEQIIGFREDELTKLNFSDITYIEDKEKNLNYFNDLVNLKIDHYELEKRYVNKDGKYIWVSLHVSLLNDPDGKPQYVIAQVINISERKKNEEKLQELNMQLTRSNNELQDFASIASHDLQEPLRKIRAFGDRLTKDYANELPEQGKDYVFRMQNAASRMQNLINDLLTYSRVTTKAQPFEKIDLNQVFEDILSDIELKIDELKAEIKIDNLPIIDGDPTQLRQLFQNLLLNALKFHKENETPVVIIKTKEIREKEVPMIEISVKDNGIGFNQAYKDKIFNIFQRLHTSKEYPGSGIGLSVCKKIVSRHNGEIIAMGNEGQGAEFIVKLPIKQKIYAK